MSLKITGSSLAGCVGGGWEEDEEEENLGLSNTHNEMALLKGLPVGARMWCEKNTLGPPPGHLLMESLPRDKGER